MELRKSKWRPSTSFWITAAIWFLLLIICIATGGFGVWIVLFALYAILTALYSLLFGRKSWIGLPNRKAAGVAVGAGFAALVLGSVAMSATTPAAELVSQVASTTTATTTPATPSPSAKSALLTKCTTATDSMKESGALPICTPGDDGVLVWMTEPRSKVLIAERAAATAKAEADKVAVKKIEDDKVAAATEAANQAAAAKAAADQAAADEAARAAVQQQPAPVQAPAAPAGGSAYYANCAAAKAAGVAPIYAGQPGYRAGLDRDKDGIACDK